MNSAYSPVRQHPAPPGNEDQSLCEFDNKLSANVSEYMNFEIDYFLFHCFLINWSNLDISWISCSTNNKLPNAADSAKINFFRFGI